MNLSRMKGRRTELGLTLKYVAQQVGVSEATCQRWESGEIKSLRYGRIEKLATALQTTPAYLMGWIEEPSNEKKAAPNNGNGLSSPDNELVEMLDYLSNDQKKMLLAQIQLLLRSEK